MTGRFRFEKVVLPKKSPLINPIEILVRESPEIVTTFEIDQEWYIKDLKEVVDTDEIKDANYLSVIYEGRRL